MRVLIDYSGEMTLAAMCLSHLVLIGTSVIARTHADSYVCALRGAEDRSIGTELGEDRRRRFGRAASTVRFCCTSSRRYGTKPVASDTGRGALTQTDT